MSRTRRDKGRWFAKSKRGSTKKSAIAKHAERQKRRRS